jgi:hypothetical protein
MSSAAIANATAERRSRVVTGRYCCILDTQTPRCPEMLRAARAIRMGFSQNGWRNLAAGLTTFTPRPVNVIAIL